MKPSVHPYRAVLALVIACLGGPAAAGPSGLSENFEGNAAGGFPAGWSDVALVDPASTTPKPSAVVVSTTDAFGNPTRALATLPAIAPSQGIYRTIVPSGYYSMRADVRIDRFSDFDPNADPVACGCPPDSEVDFPMQIGFMRSGGAADPFHLFPQVGLYPGARTEHWRLIAFTANVVMDLDLGVPVTVGKWYGLQLDLDPAAATVHSHIIDVANGTTLIDLVSSLPSSWVPTIDGVFNIASFYDGELTARTTSGLAVVDNIDIQVPEPATMILLASALAGVAAARRRK